MNQEDSNERSEQKSLDSQQSFWTQNWQVYA